MLIVYFYLTFQGGFTSEGLFLDSVSSVAKGRLGRHADPEDYRVSQTQSEILRAISALPVHTKIMAELRELRLHSNADQKQPSGKGQILLLRHLSDLDFTAMQ